MREREREGGGDGEAALHANGGRAADLPQGVEDRASHAGLSGATLSRTAPVMTGMAADPPGPIGKSAAFTEYATCWPPTRSRMQSVPGQPATAALSNAAAGVGLTRLGGQPTRRRSRRHNPDFGQHHPGPRLPGG